MADKETSIYIVDLGSTMADCHNGRTESDLDWSMRWVWDKISTTVAASRKTWHVGVLGVRTDETDNSMQDEEGYDHISVLQELQPMDLGLLRTLQAKIRPSETDVGDCISALIPAIDMIETVAPQRLKFNRKIFMVTSGEAPLDLDPNDIESIAERLRKNNIQLTILYAFTFRVVAALTLTLETGVSISMMPSTASRRKTRRSRRRRTNLC